MSQRKCDDFLGTFMSWVLPRTEARESYILYSGIFCVAAALRRQVSISKDYLGGWTCFPTMYILFVGPPGAPRKTSTMKFANTLLDRVQDLYAGGSILTQAALMQEMSEGSTDGSIYLTVGEFSDLVMKSKQDQYEFLTSAFDGAKEIRAKTIGRGEEVVHNPCINLLAATTPKWLGANLTEEQIGGGFSSRVLFIFEDAARRKKLFYDSEIDQKEFDAIEELLLHDLRRIAKLKGEFKFTTVSKKLVTDWYSRHDPSKASVHVRGYSERKATHLLKMMMICSASRSDDLTISKEDFHVALKYLGVIEKKLPLVFAGIGKNIYKLDQEEILKMLLIVEKKGMKTSTLIKELLSVGTESVILELVSTLASSRLIDMKDSIWKITKEGKDYLKRFDDEGGD